MQLFKIIQRVRIERTQHIVSLIGIFDFLDFFLRANDRLPADDAFHLVQR